MQQIVSTATTQTKKNIINRIADVPGGVSLVTANLVAGKIVEEAAPLTKPATGVRTVCKQAIILAGSTATAIKVESATNHFVVGEFIGIKIGGKAYAITGITTASGIDTIAVGTAIDTPVTGEFIYEMAAESTGLDATLNVAYANDTATGLTDVATSVSTGGTPQAADLTVVGTVGAGGAGNVNVTVSSDMFVDEVIAVAVANSDTASIVATKVRAALSANAVVIAYFDVAGLAADVVLTHKAVTAYGATLENVPEVIMKDGFVAPTAAQVILIRDAYIRADIHAGRVGSDYLATLPGIIEINY